VSDFIIGTARALMAVMQPATGTRSTGVVTLTALAAQTVNLKRGQYAYPVLGGRASPELLIKVGENPATDDGSWDVTDAGLAVTFISNLGGARYNLPATTPIILDNPPSGLVVALPTADADFTGGIDATGFGAVLDLVMAEQLSGPALHVDMRRSQLTRFPSVMVTWEDVQPADGSSTVTAGRGSARVGTRSLLFKSSYTISVITSRKDTDHERRHEGLFMVGTLARLITDRQMVDGECLSNPSGIQIRSIFREVGPQDIYQKFYIYHMLISAHVTIQQFDSRTYSDWLLAVLNVDKPQDPALPNQGDYRIVTDNEIDMS